MFIKLNKTTFYVDFKKRIYSYIHYTHRGIPLHLYQNNIIYHSTDKNTTGKFFTITQIQMENKTIYHSTNK